MANSGGVTEERTTDTIPRVRIAQILDVLELLRSAETRTFEEVRAFLRSRSGKFYGSPDAMATVARDILADLQRLNLMRGGPIPRKRSEVHRLSESRYQLDPAGASLITLFR